ncbi:alpha/beta hydrolase [Bacillus sp. 31A1R]|uniref:Alpha/beta hydrolase n=1 Tax=Robertmurraya mangrovi TaxID=3098077 RepID=A0ABU5J1Z1_9BACI|nr:alpha/beta hydrolase [Bacillus sp. 31A1R]MDZ5473365.1 alpha/beta hydrolase [Bacillus sp. 31A1R]
MKRELEVMIPAAYPLAGTLTLPEGNQEKYPLIVFVHGSGDIDRDSNAKGLAINIFKELSDLAVAEGFATIRYDKRGVGESKGDFLEAGVYDLIDDAQAVLEFAKKQPGIDPDRVILLGHSEGSIIAPFVNERVPVNGMVLLAGTAECLARTTEWQREKMMEDVRSLRGFQGWLLRLLKLDQKIEKMNEDMSKAILSTDAAVIKHKGKKINAKWNREHGVVDVSKVLVNAECPVLAITGTKDINVKLTDLDKMRELIPGECETHVIENMNHILRKTDKEGFSTIINEYKKIVKQPVDRELKDLLSGWLSEWKNREATVEAAELVMK